MKQLLLLFLIVTSFGLTGQNVIGFSPDSIYQDLTIDDRLVDAKFDLTNTTDISRNLIWVFDRGDSPEEWTYQICDKWLCYQPGTESMPAGADPSDIESQGSIADAFKVTLFNTGGVKGSAQTVFRVYDFSDPSTELGSINITWSVQGGTSTIDLTETQVHVYPNPAADFFKVSATSEINTITLYDFLGRKVDNYNYSKEGEYDLTGVEKGIYYVACYDKKGETVSTKRLMKN